MKKYLSKTAFILTLIFIQPLWGQVTFDFSDQEVISRLKQDIYTLASEEMEGREAGTEGERKAAKYIKDQMIEIGLEPLFDGTYYQEFTFDGPWTMGEDNFLRVNTTAFVAGEDFHTLPGSANAVLQASFVDVGYGVKGFEEHNDYQDLQDIEGKIFVMEYYLPETLADHADLSPLEEAGKKIQVAKDKGAEAVIFINTSGTRSDPRILSRLRIERMNIPVLFARENVANYLSDHPEASISLSTDINRQTFKAVNVAGYLDNHAERTVVIGGHYDHLGYGGMGSRSPGSEEIHYGADDNASGIAGMLEAARYFSDSQAGNHNYLFIAFSAEEKGLLGSRHFTASDAYDMERVNYMFNLDMIGRMEDHNLMLIGTGTSPVWDDLIEEVTPDHFNIRKNPSGMGGSDHTAFYLENIPVIFFFSGIHDDYHRPGDTPDKINYEGTSEILSLVYNMVETLDEKDRLAFTPTPVPDSRRRRSESVTLGLMPDHAFDGAGLKVQAVIDDRPAQKAGLKGGDVILRINDMHIEEITSYMNALQELEKGEKITVHVSRDDEELVFEVEL